MTKISSTIEIWHKDDKMPHKHRKKQRKPDFKSEATSDKHKFFHGVKTDKGGHNQQVNVEVKIDQKDDCITSCFAGLAKCFGRA